MLPTAGQTTWRSFALVLCATALAFGGALYAFVLALDPYGTRATRPVMDINQRFMYPQIVRSGRFDSAVFGTSTIRLLDPERLNASFGGRFANLGLNAGTPWEQMQLAELFLRHVPQPKALIFGLDTTWCEPDADEKRLTFRPFPPWLYDDSRFNDLPEFLNITSLEIAGRLLLHRLGMMPERIRRDGYEIFVPDEAFYDLERARFHLYGAGGKRPLPEPQAVHASPDARLPAFDWLDALLARLTPSTDVTLTTMPIHAVAQSSNGNEAACKARIADLARKHRAAFVDFRLRSAITVEDANYWDPLHYRVGVAERIVHGLAQGRATGHDAADGFYRVVTPPAR